MAREVRDIARDRTATHATAPRCTRACQTSSLASRWRSGSRYLQRARVRLRAPCQADSASELRQRTVLDLDTASKRLVLGPKSDFDPRARPRLAMEAYAITVIADLAGALGASMVKRGHELERAANHSTKRRRVRSRSSPLRHEAPASGTGLPPQQKSRTRGRRGDGIETADCVFMVHGRPSECHSNANEDDPSGHSRSCAEKAERQVPQHALSLLSPAIQRRA